MIPYGRQNINEDDIQAVVDVLKSDFLTQGQKLSEFEKAVSDYCGADFAVAVNSATSALHIACLALGLEKGDTVWTAPNTFVASANCARYCGADVDFVDIDMKTYNMCPKNLEEKLIFAEKNGNLPKIVIPVHFAGQSCEMDRIHSLSLKYGFRIIEDASHAIGGKYKGEPVGSCMYSDITVFSFHPVKIITTAEGGLALTNDHKLFDKMNLFRSHAVTRASELMQSESHGPWYYQQLELGYNYRMTELQAALGISQMKRLESFVSRRHEIAESYNKILSHLPLDLPYQNPDSYSSFHLYPVRVKIDGGISRRQVYNQMRAAGIGVNVHYIPVHLQPYYRDAGFKEGDFPVAEQYYNETLSIPMYPDLLDSQINEVSTALEAALCQK